MAGRRPKPKPKARDIRGAKYLKSVFELLKPLHPHKDCHNRNLHFDECVAYLLLYFFNPIVTSLNGLQQVSDLKAVTKRLKLPRFSLGSISESMRVFDPGRLEGLIAQLAGEVSDLGADVRLAALDVAATVVDGTPIRALPKMVWALWRRDGQNAAKAHVEFDLVKGAPTRATVTDHNTAETHVLRDTLTGGKLYVLDRGYVDYALMASILDAGSSFLVRVKGNSVYEITEERPVDAKARKLGVRRDLEVTLGGAAAPELHERTVRLVEMHVTDPNALIGRPRRKTMDRKTKSVRCAKTEHTLLLATDRLDLDADLIADLYRYRWQVELFFRWFKTILGADRLLSHSKTGLTLVVYCGLIASLLIALWTGRKPTKRTYEMLCLYFMGWADADEVEEHIARLAKNE
jgi:hypothetical protein